jgi:dTDP-4-dehydrorhamnose reductase
MLPVEIAGEHGRSLGHSNRSQGVWLVEVQTGDLDSNDLRQQRIEGEAMRIALLGAAGQLGADLQRTLVGDVVPFDRGQCDLSQPDQMATVLAATQPDVVVNCAAYNLVDAAEDDPAAAFATNAWGPRQLAKLCQQHGWKLVHVSTDYVFGLDRQRIVPYTELDPTGPVGVYGASKLAGETFVRAVCDRHLIVRTCGLYGQRATRAKGNFVQTMLRLGAERPELKIVADQRCTPSNTADVATGIAQLLAVDACGVYHVTNSGDCSWAEFAGEIFRLANLSPRIIPIAAADYGAKAERPGYSVLDGGQFARTVGQPLRNWRDALADDLRQRSPRPQSAM